jgi:predicted nuclease of predicted toxin-antitoxin system
MLVLVDVSPGKAIAEALRGLSHDVTEVRDRNSRMSDIDILSWAVTEQRLVVTMDKDFGELVYRSGARHSGVLLLRLDAAANSERVRVVTEIFEQYAEQLPGKFAVYQDGRLRIR